MLGELLFLLEYRDTPVRTICRPDDPFELPKDVWFIGTMNAADRSIALVDAARRRRFHFVPFFPNGGPMAELLLRWLAREGEPRWVGELVAHVNTELGGPHLLLRPSSFMKKGLDLEELRRIWEYSIEPEPRAACSYQAGPARAAGYVGDIKYKLTSDGRARTNDYYQLLAYTTTLDIAEVILIYCHGDGDVRDQTITVKNAGKRLMVRSVDDGVPRGGGTGSGLLRRGSHRVGDPFCTDDLVLLTHLHKGVRNAVPTGCNGWSGRHRDDARACVLSCRGRGRTSPAGVRTGIAGMSATRGDVRYLADHPIAG